MLYIVLLFAAAALLSGGCRSTNVNRHMKLLEMENSIDINTVHSKQGTKKYVSLIKKPNASIAHSNDGPLELTCEAVGAPAPSVHWFKNDAPVYEYDLESNEVIDTNPTSLAVVSSTLFLPKVEGTSMYSCLAVAGSNTVKASTIVQNTGDKTEPSERSKLIPFAPRILVSYKVLFDWIGSSVVLPCRARGHPRPEITWIQEKSGHDVTRDPRMKVLRTGELVITSLRWSDMGEYICHVSNRHGSQLTETFVYPARPE